MLIPNNWELVPDGMTIISNLFRNSRSSVFRLWWSLLKENSLEQRKIWQDEIATSHWWAWFLDFQKGVYLQQWISKMIEKSTSGNEAFYDATDDSCIIKHGSKYNFNTDIIINSVFSIVLKRGQHKGHHPSSMFISSELSGQDVSRFAKYSVDHGTFCCYFHCLVGLVREFQSEGFSSVYHSCPPVNKHGQSKDNIDKPFEYNIYIYVCVYLNQIFPI